MKFIILLPAVLINLFLNSQMNIDKIPYNVETTHPSDELKIEFVSDTIFTVGGGIAHIPYGGTNSDWGNSNVIFTKQYGIPKHVKITYYALYEDVFYDLDVELPVERMKDLMNRAYAIRESESSQAEMKEFIRLSEYPKYEKKFNLYNTSYVPITDFVLGFSPKGKVTVWLRYKRVQKFIGEYEATPIKNDEKIAEEFYSEMAVGREEGRKLFFINKEIPDIWSDYLYSSKWKIEPVVANDSIKVLELNLNYFNKEKETLLRPWLFKDEIKERGIPVMITVTWESGKEEGYYATIFYDWETIFAVFKESQKDEVFKISIGEDNKTIKTYFGNQEVEYDSIEIFKSDEKYRDSY